MRIGREAIYTDVEEITRENVISVLRNAYRDFSAIRSECEMLINFESGIQPLVREKTYRSDIDIRCVDNIANEVTEFKCGYDWGNVITLIQRGVKDSGSENEDNAISLLNEQYAINNIAEVQQTLARNVEICGIGYTYVDINTDYEEDGDAFFSITSLDPRYAFVVRSTRYTDKRVVMGVSFRKDTLGNAYFTCFTKNSRYEIRNLVKFLDKNGKPKDLKPEEWNEEDRSGEMNPLGLIPIIEWRRSADRMGCFERQISEMNNLNVLVSDFTNDVDQNTQAVWHCNDIDFPEDDNGNTITPKSNDWMQTYTSKDGRTPFVTPLSVQYDYSGIMNNILSRRALILQKCNVPQRNDNSGGSTGVAMSDATGWSSAENSACKGQAFKESSKMDEVKVVLRAIKKNPKFSPSNPLNKLRYCDVQPSIKRQKTYELSVKTTALATLLQCGVYGLHALNLVNAFDDNNQVWTDSKDLMEKIQKKNASDNQAQTEVKPTSDDPINQITNSPNIDGMNKEDTSSEE